MVGRPFLRAGSGRKPLRRAGREWEAIPNDWEGSGDAAPETGRVGKPYQRIGRGQEALPEALLTEGRNWSEGPLRSQEGSGGPSGASGGVGRPSLKAGTGRYALSKGLLRSGGSPGRPTWVRRTSRWARWGQDALLEGREGSGGPYSGQGRVMSPSRRVRNACGTCPFCLL